MKKPLCTIVGMGPGISYSLAKKFGSQGCTIAIVSRNENRLKKFQEDLRNQNIDCHYSVADAADFESLISTFEKIDQKLGKTDILIYNVSVFREANPTELDAETCVQDFRANVGGALVSVQQVAPYMKANKKGKILITGGGQGIDPHPPFSSLAIGKAAIRNLAMSLAGELESFGIHVATVTVCGMVAPDTRFAPNIIAEEFWKLYKQPSGMYQKEVIID